MIFNIRPTQNSYLMEEASAFWTFCGLTMLGYC